MTDAEQEPDYTYALGQAPTSLQRRFADFIMSEEVGYNPATAKSKEEAFREGVRMAVQLRIPFQASATNREATEQERLERQEAKAVEKAEKERLRAEQQEARAAKQAAKAAKASASEEAEEVEEAPKPTKTAAKGKAAKPAASTPAAAPAARRPAARRAPARATATAGDAPF